MNRTFSILALVGVTVFWGLGFVVTKDSLSPQVGPMTFSAWRFWIASGVVFLLFPKQTLRVSREALWAGGVIGVLMGLGYLFQTIGLNTTTSGNTAFITGLHVVLIPVFSTWVLKRPPSPVVAVCVGVAAIGLGLLSLGSDFSVNPGDVWILACAVVFAFQIIAIAYYVQKYDATTLAIYQIYVSAVVATVASSIFEQPQLSQIPHLWFELGFTGILGTALALYILTHVQRVLSPTQTGLIVILESPFGAFFGWWLAGEVMGSRELLGCVLILAAMVLAEAQPLLRRRSTISVN